MAESYWLVKSEPHVYSIDDLERDGCTGWDGIRNYQARNNLRRMKVGDPVLFYHSNATPPAVVGIARVQREAYPDLLALDEGSEYFDPRATRSDPVWSMVDLAFVGKAPRPLTLSEAKSDPAFAEMDLVKRGRLSVQEVEGPVFSEIVSRLGL